MHFKRIQIYWDTCVNHSNNILIKKEAVHNQIVKQPLRICNKNIYSSIFTLPFCLAITSSATLVGAGA